MGSGSEQMLREILSEIVDSNGWAAVDKFDSLRDVDAKVREARLALSSLPGLPASLLEEMEADSDFTANSRRVRLEALAHYCAAALRLVENLGLAADAKPLAPLPDIDALTASNPDLRTCLERRWYEAQICARSGAHVASIVMMGSVLEGLLHARAELNPSAVFAASAAPRRKDGSNVPLDDWSLNALLDVAVELGWLKSDRAAFGHALRQSRNVVHPLVELKLNADFDLSTARTSWTVLMASVKDLVASVDGTG